MTYALEIRNLKKSFGNLEVIRGLSLTAKKGEVLCIIGSSGSGKSTLLRCVNLLDIPDSGEVYVNGELLKMKKDFSYLGKQIDIYKQGSEDFIPEKESIDLCFTSPPYFDTEKYSGESTQSYIKFPSENEWINGLLKKTIENCYYGLKKNGYMLINIANTPKYKFIEKETVNISNEVGFIKESTVDLILSSVAGKGIKTEPVFVFRKGNNG